MDLREVIEFLKDAFKYVIVIVVVFLLFIFVVGLQQVVGPSMNPTLNEGDIMIVNKLTYHLKDIGRNDIVVIMQDEKYMVKRVVGVPGETIEYKNNHIFVNGVEFEETFIDLDKVHTNDFSIKDLGYDTIPEGKYLVLGDNRENSLDSRDYGLVDRKEIVGRAWIRIWPFSQVKVF